MKKKIIFYHFYSNPRFPPLLIYLRCKYGVTFVRRCYRDVSAIFFSIAEWTKRNLLGFVYNIHIKLISYSDFKCATDDFQKSWKNVIFKNCIKNLLFEKNQMFDAF